MAVAQLAPPRNRILAALPAAEYATLAPQLEEVELETKQILFDGDKPIEHVYFPVTNVVSVLGVMSDGTAVETATVGFEGIVGLAVFHGTDRTSAQAFIQIPGTALRMTADALRAALACSPALTLALHRYTQALFTLVAQSSACNRVHTMRERCARWLLHTHDRVGGDDFPLTHQFLSQMLGVRRATVTEAMGMVQEAGAIQYEMGVVRVLDRARLEANACECYTIIAREFDRLLGAAHDRLRGRESPLDAVETSDGGKTTIGDGTPRDPAGTRTA